MADYLITGKKGNGKSIFAVGVIRDALAAGKRVATNLDIKLEAFGNPYSKKTLIRLPDTVGIEELEFLGRGQDGVVEENNGVIVLDEVSKFLNSRQWGDKGRGPVLDWLVHSRKLGWDVYMIAQGQEQIDKQLRTSLLEYWVTVKRTDKWPIPFITPLVKALTGFRVGFPRMHIGTIRHGFDRDSLIVERKYYKGAPLYPCYDTQQIFLERDHPKACGLHSVLSPWHTKGRYLSPVLPAWERALAAFWQFSALGMAFVWWLALHLDHEARQIVAADLDRPRVTPGRKPDISSDKQKLLNLLRSLPPESRIRHTQRLISLGAI